MLRLVKNTIKQIVFIPLFIFSSAALSQTLNFDDAIQLIDEAGHIDIPEGYTSIAPNAFQNLYIKSAHLPDGMLSIGAESFINTNIESINFPESLTDIGNSAFKNTSLVDATIPDGVSLGEAVFEDSTLESVALPNDLTSIPGALFRNSQLKSVVIPNLVTDIGSEAFYNTFLQVVTLPESLQTIDRFAFRNNLLENLVIPDSTNYIGQEAFRDNPIKELVIGSGLSSITAVEPGAFHNVCFTLEKFITNSSYGDYRYSSAGRVTIYPTGSGSGGRYVYPGISLTSDSTTYQERDTCPQLRYIEFGPEVQVRTISYALSRDNTYDTVLNVNSDIEHDYYNNYSTPLRIADYITMTDTYAVENTLLKTEALIKLCSPDDSDGDFTLDCIDAFPNDPSYSSDSDSNGVPDVFGVILDQDGFDTDGDGILDAFDPNSNSYMDNYIYNSVIRENYGQVNFDSDSDGVNNFNDPDDDNDGLLDVYEPFYGTNPLIPDSDYDGVLDGLDAFPMDNTESLDTDTDGIGNNSDTDDDNDGYTDFLDAFPTDATEWADSDLDGIGNNLDFDDDNDGVADTEDAFPHTASESLDSDNDGVGDNADAFPNDATEVADTDSDGIGNNTDPDDDNDGVADADDGDPLNADIGIQPSQLISVAGNPVGVNGHSTRISISYDTSDGDNQLPGIGFRVHYSSEMLSFVGTESAIGHDLIVNGDGPYQDDSDIDNNAYTDKYILFGWASLNGNWPNVNLPASLVDVVFDVNWETPDQASITTPINFSKVDTTEGYNFEATNYALNVLPATWDFDGNGQADALTDGLILLRHAFGVRGATLTSDVMAPDATMTPEKVELAVEKAAIIADVDGNGEVNALTDALVVLRYMFGLRDEILVSDVIAADASRSSAEDISQHIELYMP